MSTEITMPLSPGQVPNPATTCSATETFHHFCGHVATHYTHHSDLCTSRQNRPKTVSRPSTSGSSMREALTTHPPVRSSSIKEFGQKFLRSLSFKSRQDKSDTILEFSYQARVPCPQVIYQPLYDAAPCVKCSEAMGVKPGEALGRDLTDKEREKLEQGREKVDADHAEWVVRMNEWDNGTKVLRKGH